jgi:tRNA(Ile)-lysidine synthase
VPVVTETGPVPDDEVDRLFAALPDGPLVLAVSGGSDSMALMMLVAGWRERTGSRDIWVASVDHGLREEAAAEVKFVLRQARKLGFAALGLKWPGPFPETGIAAAAREARYSLLCKAARERGAALVTAHTMDDQAETFLMNLMRGSGLDGLSAMPALMMRDGVRLARPFLAVTRLRLRASLEHEKMAWVEDPTNLDPAFERVRVRSALETLGELGLTVPAIARSAERLGRAREAVERQVSMCSQALVEHDEFGFATIKPGRPGEVPDEVLLRVVMRLAAAYGGGAYVSLSGAEKLLQWLRGGTSRARTLAGCRFVRRKASFLVGREPGRIAQAVKTLECGAEPVIWDGRYRIGVAGSGGPFRLGAVKDMRGLTLPGRPSAVPAFVWQGLPAAASAAGDVWLPGLVPAKTAENTGNVQILPIWIDK